MVLLFITRKLDQTDSRAGFVYGWLAKISRHLDKLIVICQETGDYSGLPDNIQIHSLGKEKGNSKFKQLMLFEFLMIKNLSRVDGIFAHMMPLYSILAGPWAKIFNKQLIQWYTHAKVDWCLRLANIFVSQFATASRLSFRLKTAKKVNILGHGIDTEQFKPGFKKQSKEYFNIITLGRISPTKDYESMLKAIYQLYQQGVTNIHLSIIGDIALPQDASYLKSLETMLNNMNLNRHVEFIAAVPHRQTVPYYQSADLFINLSHTGSLDKALLEAMACGCLVVTSNESFKSILAPELIVKRDDPLALAEKIKYFMRLPADKKNSLTSKLRQTVVEFHNLDNLAKRIIELYK